MSTSPIQRHLQEAYWAVDSEPNAYSHDLEAVVQFTSDLGKVFGTFYNHVCVQRAIVELVNNSGYPVGHLVFDSETEAHRFVAWNESKES